MADRMTIDAVLTPAACWRATKASGALVVLKKLPDDCLRAGRLHPAIALRLTRLREAPLAALANLIGVQSTDVGVVIVSEFVAGRSFDAMSPAEQSPHLPAARRAVEALHRVGLVHGAIGPGNFVVENSGRVRLIDPSPFLYDDPAADWADFDRMAPDATRADARPRRKRFHAGSLAAAVALAVVAIAGGAAWAWHVAGRS